MDANVFVAALAALVALGAMYFTGQQAKAAKRQTELQQRMREDAAQPYVWADLRPDEEHGFIIALVVRNEGPTVATNIRVAFDPPLVGEFADHWDPKLVKVASLVPGRQIVWWIKEGPGWYEGERPRSFEVTIDCAGPFGPAPQLRYQLNTNDFGEEQPRKSGSLYAVTKSLDALTKAVKENKPKPHRT